MGGVNSCSIFGWYRPQVMTCNLIGPMDVGITVDGPRSKVWGAGHIYIGVEQGVATYVRDGAGCYVWVGLVAM